MSSPGCLSKTSEQPKWGGGKRQSSSVAAQTCATRRDGTRLANLSNGEGCFSLKLKTRAAIYRESTPPQFSIFTWYPKYCCPGCHAAGPCVFCDSVSDFECFLKVVYFIFFILKSLNKPIPGCHRALFFYCVLSQWRRLAGDPSYVGVRPLLFWNILQHETKIDVPCPAGGTELLCRPKDRLWGISAI